MSMDTTLFNFLLIFALASLMFQATLVNSEPTYTFIKSLCIDAEHVLETPYKNNLDKLLSSFPSIASQSSNNGYYATNSTSFKASNSETIYGLFLCQGDVNPIDCQRCVSKAISTLPMKECPTAKSAVIWYDKCMVRYSNKSFLTTVDEDVKLRWENKQRNISITPYDASKSMILGCNTLFNIAFEMSSSSKVYKGVLQKSDNKYYATRDVAYNSSVGIYTMAQCTSDLSANDCDSCLRLLISDMTTFCVNSSISVRVLNPSCNIWCETYRLQSTMQPMAEGSFMSRRNSILVALPTSATMSILLCIGIWYFLRNRNVNVDISEIKKAVDSLQFDINKIRAATRNFAPDNKLGEGGFGEVYKVGYHLLETLLKSILMVLSMVNQQQQILFLEIIREKCYML